jgi:hypothetical protein
MDWYYSHNGERKGPVELETIKALLAAGTLSKNNLVWNESMGTTWTRISDVSTLAGPQTAPEDPLVAEEFKRKMEERNQLLARQRRATWLGFAVVAVVVVIIIESDWEFDQAGSQVDKSVPDGKGATVGVFRDPENSRSEISIQQPKMSTR